MDSGGVARVAAATLLVGTVAAQHPNSAFGRVKRWDTMSALFPNWRFFAPEPAQHDYDVFYRVRDADGTDTEWIRLHEISTRRLSQFVWFPERRPEKGLFDIVSEMMTTMSAGVDRLMASPPYAMLRSYVAHHLATGADEADGFQFSIVRHAGYDETEDVEIVFVSPYIPMRALVTTGAAQHCPAHGGTR